MSTKIWLMATAVVAVIIGGAVMIPGPSRNTTKDIMIAEQKAKRIEKFFEKRGMPMARFSDKFVAEAEKYGLDWRLMPAISVIESSGGKFACEFNSFGWRSCKGYNFKSWEEAIETVAKNIGGGNPNTASFYSGKSTEEILRIYNPPSVRPDYVEIVTKIMDQISGKTE